jgi:hypothetical protein
MDKVTFIVDTDGGLAWLAPSHAPDLTDEQARTIAISDLSGAIKSLAAAIENFCEQKTAEIAIRD